MTAPLRFPKFPPDELTYRPDQVIQHWVDKAAAWEARCRRLHSTMQWIATVEGLGPLDDRVRAARIAMAEVGGLPNRQT